MELEVAGDEDDDDGSAGVVAGGEVPGGAVTSFPSCDPWMSRGC